MDLRRRFKEISTQKDLPLDGEHKHLREVELWDEDHPIIFHIRHSTTMFEGNENQTDIDFSNLMKSDRNTIIPISIF